MKTIENPKPEINLEKLSALFHPEFKVPTKEVTLHDFQLETIIDLTEANILELRKHATSIVHYAIADAMELDLKHFKSTVRKMSILKGEMSHA